MRDFIFNIKKLYSNFRQNFLCLFKILKHSVFKILQYFAETQINTLYFMKLVRCKTSLAEKYWHKFN